ncbi:polysaccharide pyruvyl transferase family protein [Oleiharenicola lentus]|uniref:Polysaccharide pyruvyl transferase family protein n=1 Tax=Oleiharenicola lentus TaxID=2508720 RepID=A0A4Q1C3T9_9BACT|nr:polysaccharide pyruvyl transferase family protein [Oleiharenicola lentus]RXK52919.1 polysaccharide pyruvyl transferase family protein [Oleiharenicola lentus]
MPEHSCFSTPAPLNIRTFIMRVLFLGIAVSSSNRGVLALGSSLIGLTRQSVPTAEIGLLIGHNRTEVVPFRVGETQLLVPVIPCRLSPRSSPKDHLLWIMLVALAYRLTPSAALRRRLAGLAPWVEAISRADMVGDIRGGDSFSDIYGLSRFLHGFFLQAVVLLVRGDIAQMPQTYGPYKSGLARALARFLLLRSGTIIARDLASRQVAQTLVGTRKKILLSPDVAFSLQPIPPQAIHLDPPQAEGGAGKIIGINVNGLMFNGGYNRKNMFGLKLDYQALLPELIRTLLDRHPGEIWLIPHTFALPGSPESDPEASRLVRESLPPEAQARVRIVTGDYDQHEIKAVIGKCSFLIGSRMHACIAALSQGIPCVGVAYSMKFRGVFESVGMQDWIVDGRDHTHGDAINRILALHQQCDVVREDLNRRANETRIELRRVFDELLKSGNPS